MGAMLKNCIAGLAVLLTTAACVEQPGAASGESLDTAHELAGAAAISNQNVIQVIARHEGTDYAFDLLENGHPIDEVPSGWTTFQLDNHSGSAHFVYLARVPEAAMAGADSDGAELLDYWYDHVTRPFQWFMDTLIDGKEPNTADLSDKYTTDTDIFPPWFRDAVPMGGPGFTQGHESSRTTVNLEPGTYIVECYVKNADGDFHSYIGMITLLTVTEEQSGASEPRPTLTVNLTTGQIDVDDHIRPGLHTVAVRFQEQSVYDHLLGHDVHLVRLDEAGIDEVVQWMNWMLPDGLVDSSAARGPTTFLGGAQTMAVGNTAYFTVDLKPGDYAWVAEVPEAAGMWKTFTVPSVGDVAEAAGQ